MGSLRLSGALGVRDAGQVAENIRDALHGADGLTIETDQLQSIDLSILQILISAHKAAREGGKSLSVAVPQGGAVDAVLRRSGVADAADAQIVRDGEFWTAIGLS